MSYKFSEKSWKNLKNVHPKLVAVASYTLWMSDLDFTVLEGTRSKERQKELFNSGASRTMNSKHLTGRAIDLGVWIPGEGVSWHWPYYEKLAHAVKASASTLKIKIKWGGDWKTFKDGPHFELDDSEI